MGGSAALTAATKAKKDEFYTQRVDIENELRHYKVHFKGKVVLCNCDDPRQVVAYKSIVGKVTRGSTGSGIMPHEEELKNKVAADWFVRRRK